jgi:hypothetical protein
MEGGIKTFHDKQKLKHYRNTKPALQKILKEILHTKDENKHSTKGRKYQISTEEKESDQKIA